jgi:hypothetical protein
VTSVTVPAKDAAFLLRPSATADTLSPAVAETT